MVDDRAVFQLEADDDCFLNYLLGTFADGGENDDSIVIEPHMQSNVEEWLIGRNGYND